VQPAKTLARRRRLRRIGKTPEARVKWVLDYLDRDPRQFSADEHRAVAVSFYTLEEAPETEILEDEAGTTDFVSRAAKIADPLPLEKVASELLLKTHELLRHAVTELAHGRPIRLEIPAQVWTLRPAPPRSPGTRHSAFVTRDMPELITTDLPPYGLPSMVVLNVIDDLNTVGADRLRACPLEQRGARCDRIFLSRNNKQRYCTHPHAQAAAWQAYLARGGDIERKKRRKS
jgi:hypothetical protein